MERDYMSRVADKVGPMLMRLKLNVRQKVFLGPGVTRLNPKEALTRLQQLSPEERMEMVKQAGRDEFMSQVESLLEGAANAKSRTE